MHLFIEYAQVMRDFNERVARRLAPIQGNTDDPAGEFLTVATHHFKCQFALANACGAGQGQVMNAWPQFARIACCSMLLFALHRFSQQFAQFTQFLFTPDKDGRGSQVCQGMVVFFRFIAGCQESHRAFLALNNLPVEHRHEPAMLLNR